jgi:hypothetical protein
LLFINAALAIAILSSTLTIKEMLKRMKSKHRTIEEVLTNTKRVSEKWTNSSFVMHAKLTMTSIVLIIVLIIYDIIEFIELYNEPMGHLLLSYISDIFALSNPILLLLFSKQVRSLFL